MNNFKAITSNLGEFMKFARENGWVLNCDLCMENPCDCSNNCERNLFLYLKSKEEDESVSENEISTKEFAKYLAELQTLTNCTVNEYAEINYAINKLKEWQEQEKQLTPVQKEMLLQLKSSYEEKMEHFKRLEEIFNCID